VAEPYRQGHGGIFTARGWEMAWPGFSVARVKVGCVVKGSDEAGLRCCCAEGAGYCWERLQKEEKMGSVGEVYCRRRRWRRSRGSDGTRGSLEKMLMEEERWLAGNMKGKRRR